VSAEIQQRTEILGHCAEYLQRAGRRVLDRDWNHELGRLDLVTVDRHTFVVCAVRIRGRRRLGPTSRPLSIVARRRLWWLAGYWLKSHGMRFDRIRVDVMELHQNGPDGYTIEHLQGVDQQ
jgi:putative endonuclease